MVMNIDDLILNIVGGILGFLIYIALNAIRNHLPNLGNNVMVSMYGRTENYGNICLCHEKNLKSLYINVSLINLKENFSKILLLNNKYILLLK